MSSARIRCPGCEAVLAIPETHTGTKIQCSRCETRFRIPSLSDADILALIGSGNKDDTLSNQSGFGMAAETELAEDVVESVIESLSAPQMGSEGPFVVLPGISLVRVSRRGVLFEIQSDVLREETLRGAMPRCCLRCGSKTHLHAHMVIFGHQMADCANLEPEFVPTRPEVGDVDIRNQSASDVLAHFKNVPKLPEPANLPMPFWVCDMCSPADMVFAQGEIDPKTQKGRVHMRMTRLWRAKEFIVNVGGKDSPADQQMQFAAQEQGETAWDTLAGSVQQRLRQWYKPLKNEQFVAYIPDRTHSRTEDGMSGVVVSNRRLLFHSSMRHYEIKKGESMELDFAMDAGKMKLHIKTAQWDVKNVIIDKASLSLFRRALAKEKFSATWR